MPQHHWLRDRISSLSQTLFLKSFRIAAAAGPDEDARLVGVPHDGREFRLAATVRRGRIGHAALRDWLERTKGDPLRRDWLLAAPALGQEIADHLRAQRRSFIDAAGNCFLCPAGGRFVADLRAVATISRTTVPATRLARIAPANLRVLFAILADPRNLGRPLREVAARSGVSYQTVASTLRGLRVEGLLDRVGRSGHAWVGGRTEELVDRFVSGWRSQLRPHLLRATLATGQAPEQDEVVVRRVLKRAGVPWAFGGSAGAYHLAPVYRGATTEVHIASAWERSWNRDLRAAPSREGSLVVVQTMGVQDLVSGRPHAHPLLLYAELQTSTDPREREFARELLPQVMTSVSADVEPAR